MDTTLSAAIFNDTSNEQHFGCTLVMAELRRRLLDAGLQPKTMHYVGADWRKEFEDDRVPRPFDRGTADVVVVNGEGSIHHASSRPRARVVSEIARLARDYFKAPGVLLNATIHAIDRQCADELRLFSSIYVRDQRSQRELHAFGIRSEVVPDITLAASFPVTRKRSGICGTDSVLPAVTEEIRSACSKKSGAFLPMRWTLRRPWQLLTTPSAKRYAAKLASYALVVTGRFHAVCFCLATRTPFVAVDSNTPKISSLVEDALGSTRRVVTLDLVENLNTSHFSGWESDEAEALDQYLAFARKRNDWLFQSLGSRALAKRNE
jgi:hypothetical protein